MSRHYLDSCSVCDGYCLYAKFARRDIVLTSVHNESNSQINEFDCPNQFSQQPPFASPNYHSHYIPQILNGPRHPHANRPDQYPCINGPDQPPQITEINNINNDFRPVQHSQIINRYAQQPRHPQANRPDQFPQHPYINGLDQLPQITKINTINNDQIICQLRFNTLIIIIEITQFNPFDSFSNVTVQPLQEFRNCSCLVCGILKSQCFQSFGEESQNENCVIWNQQNEE
ncbi:16416_t:CDS:2, partial [Gigaspora rosea]